MNPSPDLDSLLDQMADGTLDTTIAQNLTKPILGTNADALFQRLDQARTLIDGLPQPPAEPSLVYRHPKTNALCSTPIGTRLTVGRLPLELDARLGSDLSFPFKESESLSRCHFEIKAEEGCYIVQQKGAQGIFINGASSASPEHRLRAGDIISAGSMSFIFTHGG